MKTIKRIIFMLCVILLVAVVCKSTFEIKEAIVENTACGHDRISAWGNMLIWSAFSCCVYEVLCNIMFFLVYKRERTSLLSWLNRLSLVLSIIGFGGAGSLLIILLPFVYFAYFIVKTVYLIAFIKNAVDLKREQMDC